MGKCFSDRQELGSKVKAGVCGALGTGTRIDVKWRWQGVLINPVED